MPDISGSLFLISIAILFSYCNQSFDRYNRGRIVLSAGHKNRSSMVVKHQMTPIAAFSPAGGSVPSVHSSSARWVSPQFGSVAKSCYDSTARHTMSFSPILISPIKLITLRLQDETSGDAPPWPQRQINKPWRKRTRKFSQSGTKGLFLRVVDRHRLTLKRYRHATRPGARWTSVQTRRAIPRKSNQLFQVAKGNNRIRFGSRDGC